MTKEDAILKIKELLKFNSIQPEIPTMFLDIKDSEGNILRVNSEELKVGDELKIVSEAGEELTPSKTYILEDGRTITTDENSIILTLTPMMEPEVEMSAEVAEPTAEVTSVEETEDAEVDETDTNVEARIGQLEELVKELLANQNKAAEATFSIVDLLEKYGATPVLDDKISDLRSTFSSTIINEKQDPQSIKERNLLAIREIRSKK